MDFELSDDQQALRDAAREVLDKESSPERVRAADGFDRKLWASLVEQGWMGVELSESSGGLGLGMVEAAVLLEEIGAHTAPVPFLESQLALTALSWGDGDDSAGEWAGEWIERLATGDAVGCVAWDASSPVLYAPDADVAILCRDDELVAIELGDRKPGREPAMDLTRRLAWLDSGDRPGMRLGGADAARRLLDRGATGHAAQLLGESARVLEMATQYAKDRVQFGRPIGSFQAVKHRCADMVVDVEGMRSCVYYAAWCIGAGHPEASMAASTAKVWCSDAAKRVMASGLQVHGGIGFTWEHDLHLYMKRAQLDQVSFGDATFHRERLARSLRARVEAGESVL